ncbi:MAG TPA: arylesterase, partial [Bryobacteraceae bacterium]|nr:arylesterase [Bryobacteraceae bacterium]
NTSEAAPIIAVLGDSLAEGFGVDSEQSFPARVQEKLNRAGYRYKVVTLGVSGDTTSGGLSRLDYLLSLKPQVVVLELGGNDGLRGVDVKSTRANLEQMIVRSKAAGAKVLLAGMTLPPNYGAEYIRRFESTYKDLSRKHDVPLIPFLMEEIRAKLLSGQRGLLQGDGIHPTARGHELIAGTVFEALKPLLSN